MSELIVGVGVMLFVGAGFRATLAGLTLRHRRRTGELDPAQARRALTIYASATIAGALLIAVGVAL